MARVRGKRVSWRALMHDLKRHKEASVADDRRQELCQFFQLQADELQQLEREHGPFNSDRFKLYLYSFFDQQRKHEDAVLRTNYADASLAYSIRLLLGYGDVGRYATIYPYLEFILARCPRGSTIIDYGSGVGDCSLVLATLGFHPTLVDLPDRKFDFACWRLAQRGLPHARLNVTSDCPYPTLPPNAALVVAIEVFEHLRHPLIALRNINAVTKPGALFFNTTGPEFQREDRGDHLPDGMEEGRSPEFQKLFHDHWERLEIMGEPSDLYLRRA